MVIAIIGNSLVVRTIIVHLDLETGWSQMTDTFARPLHARLFDPDRHEDGTGLPEGRPAKMLVSAGQVVLERTTQGRRACSAPINPSGHEKINPPKAAICQQKG
jgi:hypothetical protein